MKRILTTLTVVALAASAFIAAVQGQSGAQSVTADALKGIEPGELTPREALDALYRLKTLLDERP